MWDRAPGKEGVKFSRLKKNKKQCIYFQISFSNKPTSNTRPFHTATNNTKSVALNYSSNIHFSNNTISFLSKWNPQNSLYVAFTISMYKEIIRVHKKINIYLRWTHGYCRFSLILHRWRRFPLQEWQSWLKVLAIKMFLKWKEVYAHAAWWLRIWDKDKWLSKPH